MSACRVQTRYKRLIFPQVWVFSELLLKQLLLSLSLGLHFVLVNCNVLFDIIDIDRIINYVTDVFLHALLHFFDLALDILRVPKSTRFTLGSSEKARELTHGRGAEPRDHWGTSLYERRVWSLLRSRVLFRLQAICFSA